jgi:hypothetical protein
MATVFAFAKLSGVTLFSIRGGVTARPMANISIPGALERRRGRGDRGI